MDITQACRNGIASGELSPQGQKRSGCAPSAVPPAILGGWVSRLPADSAQQAYVRSASMCAWQLPCKRHQFTGMGITRQPAHTCHCGVAGVCLIERRAAAQGSIEICEWQLIRTC